MRFVSLLTLAFILGIPTIAGADKPLVIAVIDTGFAYKDRGYDAKLCRYGHRDFTTDRIYSPKTKTVAPVPLDLHGHGTNVVGLIERALKGRKDYCLVIIKFYSETQSAIQSLNSSINSFQYANHIKADIINYSGGGEYYSSVDEFVIKNYLNNGGKIVAAAGNNSKNLNGDINNYYPAEYDDRIVVVGNVDDTGALVPSSNYGKCVNRLENGFEQEAYGITMTGTSQATAVATGKIALEMLNARN